MSEFNFFNTDLTEIKREMKADYEAMSGKTLYEGSAEALAIDWHAYWIWHTNCSANEFAKQNLPKYATGSNLDVLLENLWGMERIKTAPAETILRFYAASGKKQSVPMGELVTHDGEIYFETENTVTADGTREDGINYADVRAVCTTYGLAGNGIEAYTEFSFTGLSNIERVVNLRESFGGKQKESDEEYYLRYVEESKGYSTAGPLAAYDYLGKRATNDVIDVRTVEEDDAIVIYIIAKEIEGVEAADVAKAVEEYVNESKAKPQGDKVIVRPCTDIYYDLKITYKISSEDIGRTEEIENEMRSAVEEFAEWTGGAIKRALNPTRLTAMLYEAGAEFAKVEEPDNLKVCGDGERFKFSGKCTWENAGEVQE